MTGQTPSHGSDSAARKRQPKTSTSSSANSSAAAPRERRIRFGNLPKPPERLDVPYALEREEFQGMSCGEMTEIILRSQAFVDVIGRICAKLDQKRARRGSKPLYTALECESVFVYQRVCGLLAVKEARDRLAGDRADDARRILGFERNREPGSARVRKLRVGVPSEATLSRHRTRFGERRRRGAYQRMFRALLAEHAQFPEFLEEMRLTGIDGTKIETHYTCPKVDPKSKKVVNADEVTCPEGGFVGEKAGADKSGHGFNAVLHATLSGLPVGVAVTPLHHSESDAAIGLMEEFKNGIGQALPKDKVHMVIADGAYHSHRVRKAMHEAGLVERVHRVSHGWGPTSREHAARVDKNRFKIEGVKHWQANGHYELVCDCGNGKTWKEVEMRGGKPVIRTVGECKTCGERISITAGRWRKVKNSGRNGQGAFVRCMPGEFDEADHAFGNPLTFNDPLAAVYGRKRFGNGEGLNGALVTRFKLNKGKRWFRRMDQAELDVAMVFSIVHALAIWRRREIAAGGGTSGLASSTGPPGSAVAA
ncbi:MAG: hypothetical protein QOI31_1687 [Solirubrobacterales bacterium]|jgi:hypothetical protein|nr:hypothetical protein [Solirubrobacterales bacterium]